MPINPNIPLQVANPLQLQQMAYRNELARMQAQQVNQQQQQRNALRGLLQQPGAIGDDGMPTPATLGRIMQVNPDAGLKIQNQLAVIQDNRLRAMSDAIHTKMYSMGITAKQSEELTDIATTAQERFDGLIASGTPRNEAIRIVSKERNAAIMQAAQSGLLNPDQARAAQNPFDPDANKAVIYGSSRYQRVLEDQRQAREEQRQEQALHDRETAPTSAIGKLNNDYKRGLINKTDYDAAMQHQTQMPDQDAIDGMADMIGTYQAQALTGYALRSPWGQAVMERVREKYPNYNGQEFHSRQAALTKFTSGQQGNAIRSIDVALDHLGTLQAAGKALQNGDFSVLNKLANSIAEASGDPAPTNFEAAKSIVADEVVKGIIGSGGGVGDRDKAQAIFDKVKSPAQLAGAITQVQALLREQLDGLKRQYEQSTGRSGDDFDKLLSPAALKLDSSRGNQGAQGKGRQGAQGSIRGNDKGSQANGGGAPRHITSKAEYDALPVGTAYVAPDGSVRRKRKNG